MIFFLMIRQPPRSTRTDTLFPYTTLFRSKGAGYNVNLPLPETITPEQYREALQSALKRIERHGPAYLVVAFGLDTARGDPTGTWSNRAGDFHQMGAAIGAAGYPTVVVPEGGYRIRTLGINPRHFLPSLLERDSPPKPPAGPQGG